MLEQLKTDRIAQVMLVGVLIASCFVCIIFSALGFIVVTQDYNSPRQVTQRDVTAAVQPLPVATPTPVSEPTVFPTATRNTDVETARRILRAFLSLSDKEPRNMWVIFVAGGEEADWTVECRDPNKEVWVIGIKENAMTASGKSTVIAEMAYYDITTSKLQYAPLGIEAIRAAGYYPPEDVYMPLR